jgi:hypothetical protein
MARLVTVGFESGSLVAEGFTASNTYIAAATGASVRTGTYALHAFPPMSVSAWANLSYAASSLVFLRFYFRIAAIPPATSQRTVAYILSVGDGMWINAKVEDTGKMALYRNDSEFLVRTTGVVTPGVWTKIEMKVQFSTTAAIHEMKALGETLLHTGADTTTANSYALWVGLGPASVSPPSDVWWDDLAINDATGAAQNTYPGEGKILLLKPTSDNSLGSWKTGNGLTTNLWAACDNTPPIGASTETATSNIAHSANLVSTYVANCQSYSAAGLAGSDVVNLTRAFLRHGEDVATGTKAGLVSITANPADGAQVAFNFGLDAGAHGAEPGLWKTTLGNITYSPAVVLSTSPRVAVVNNTASTRKSCVDLMGVIVDYTPGTGNTTTTKTATGLSRITGQTTQSSLGTASVKVQVSRFQTGLSRIRSTVTKTLTGASRITGRTLATIPAKAAVKVTVERTTSGASRIKVSVPRTVSAVARIRNTVDRVQTGLSRIRNTVTKTQTGLSRVRTTVTATIPGKANVRGTVTKTTTGVSSIIVSGTTTKVIQGVAAIKDTITRTLSGRGRVQITSTKTLSGVSRVRVTMSPTLLGTARIRVTVARTVSGLSRIKQTVTRAQPGVSRLRCTVAATLSGTADIRRTVSATITGLGRVRRTVYTTLTATSRIRRTVAATQSGLSRIARQVSAIQTGVASIVSTISVDRSVSCVSSILNTANALQTGKSSVRVSVSRSLSGRAAITRTSSGYADDIDTLGKIVVVNAPRKFQSAGRRKFIDVTRRIFTNMTKGHR